MAVASSVTPPRDSVGWTEGCLSSITMTVTSSGIMPCWRLLVTESSVSLRAARAGCLVPRTTLATPTSSMTSHIPSDASTTHEPLATPCFEMISASGMRAGAPCGSPIERVMRWEMPVAPENTAFGPYSPREFCRRVMYDRGVPLGNRSVLAATSILSLSASFSIRWSMARFANVLASGSISTARESPAQPHLTSHVSDIGSYPM
mmetsp:Transcript_83607/g.235919  ORF Transcript_83607/g.235919 Transcript_83607/m.235919 type:complete len:205 (+) Transcript_83607:134-748(+)